MPDTTQWPFTTRRTIRLDADEEWEEDPSEQQIEQAVSAAPDPVTATPAAPKRKRKPVQSIAPEDFVGPPLPPPEIEPLRDITHTDKTPLNFTIGIELTAMPNLSEKERYSFGGDMASYQARIVKEMLRFKKQAVNEVHRDVNAVEVSSQVLTTWGEVKKFYDNVTNAFDRVGLLAHVEDTISGGGHIHVGGMNVSHQVNTLRDLQNRPYLNWIFNDPDDETTMSYAYDLEKMSAKLKRLAPQVDLEVLEAFGSVDEAGKSALLFYGNPTKIAQDWFPDDKRRMARVKNHYDDHTLEFRFFQTPVDWNEQQAQLEFVLRYIKWTAEEYKDTPAVVTLDTLAKVKAITEEQCVIEFRKLLAKLRLPEAPYERFLRDNLQDWFERGARK